MTVKEESDYKYHPKSIGMTSVEEQRSVDVLEISGIIKWFDVAKGYGFVTPDGGEADVLLHVTCLRRDGYYNAPAGARIVLEALKRSSGLQALKVLSIDISADPPAQRLRPSQTHFVVANAFEKLQVKWFNRVKGYGFLSKGDSFPDVFIHMETLRHYGLTELYAGQSVFARYGKGPNGLVATEVSIDGQKIHSTH